MNFLPVPALHICPLGIRIAGPSKSSLLRNVFARTQTEGVLSKLAFLSEHHFLKALSKHNCPILYIGMEICLSFRQICIFKVCFVAARTIGKGETVIIDGQQSLNVKTRDIWSVSWFCLVQNLFPSVVDCITQEGDVVACEIATKRPNPHFLCFKVKQTRTQKPLSLLWSWVIW